MRARSLAILFVAGLVATGCSGGTSASSSTSTRAPQPAGALPSPISKMVCSPGIQRELTAALGLAANVSSPTWVDHRYACTYAYPSSTPPGSFEVSVKELSSWSETYAYFATMVAQLGKARDLPSLGQAAFQTTDGSVVVRKDWKVLLVDNTGLPPQFGVPPTSAAAVSVTVADVILGCWAGD